MASLVRMLRDDRTHRAQSSVLLASHSGALLYPKVGYEQIGTLLMLGPRLNRGFESDRCVETEPEPLRA